MPVVLERSTIRIFFFLDRKPHNFLVQAEIGIHGGYTVARKDDMLSRWHINGVRPFQKSPNKGF